MQAEATAATKALEVHVSQPNLHAQRAEIESELGTTLDWEEKPETRRSRIRLAKKWETREPSEWPKIHDWMLTNLEKMRGVFRHRVKNLRDEDWQVHQ